MYIVSILTPHLSTVQLEAVIVCVPLTLPRLV